MVALAAGTDTGLDGDAERSATLGPMIRTTVGGAAVLDDFYTPLDVAVDELHRRRADARLVARVAAFRGTHPPDFLPAAPCAILVRAVPSPDYEMAEFARRVAASGLTPLCLELRRDRFVSFNRDKYCRGKLTFCWGAHRRALRVVDFHRHDGRPFDAIPTVAGEPLREFHRALLAQSHPELADSIRDGSPWLAAVSRGEPSYLPLLSLAIRDGILLENFCVNDPAERRFTETRVLPAFAAAAARFGVRPLVVPIAPPRCEDEPHWWHYPGALFPIAQQRARRRAVVA